MSDYPMLISNKLHSFRNFHFQKYDNHCCSNISRRHRKPDSRHAEPYRQYKEEQDRQDTTQQCKPHRQINTFNTGIVSYCDYIDPEENVIDSKQRQTGNRILPGMARPIRQE